MRLLSCIFLLFLHFSTAAQHYYQQIVSTAETGALVSLYKLNGIRSVTLTTRGADNAEDNSLRIAQNWDGKTLITTTRNETETISVLESSFNDSDRIVRSLETEPSLRTLTTYTWDASGKLIQTETEATDSAGRSMGKESQRWQYRGRAPVRMVWHKAGKDSVVVELRQDDAGRVTEEREIRRGRAAEPVYYYYDAAGRLTDIVRYNAKARRLLPEQLLEYSPKNQVVQRIQVPPNGDVYTIFRYQYSADGLRTREAVYDKRKKLVARVEYVYTKG